jgi:hypothetical protein
MLTFVIVSAIALLFVPVYLAFAVAMSIVFAWLCGSGVFGEKAFHGSIVALALIGWILVGVKCWDRLDQSEHEKAEEAREREQKALCKRKEERMQREERRQRKLALTEHKALVDGLGELVEHCGPQAVEMMRVAKVWGGGTFRVMSAPAIVMHDAMHILCKIVGAAGSVPDTAKRLCYSICTFLEPERKYFISVRLSPKNDEERELMSRFGEVEDQPVTLPVMVSLLETYDKSQSMNLAPQAVAVYALLVIAASKTCADSLAARIVADHFTELLGKYRSAESSSGDSSYSAYESKGAESVPNPGGNCPECRNYYPVLGVKADATAEVIEKAYKVLVNVWHPDRFENNEGLRHATEERFKDIQEAYKHVMTHFERASR